MSDTANSVGGSAYQSQTTKALSSISESPGPDLSDGEQQFVEMISRHDYQIKFLANNQQQLQVGVNQATSNPVQQVQQFIADLQVLLSGESLAKGQLDFGDLQYVLPAIGALFGFGVNGEYPINLFDAAWKFFAGYVVPNQQYTDLQIAGFNSWAQAFGLDPQFIKDMDAMTQAFGDLFNGLQNLGPSLASLFDALGISGTDLGPLGQALSSILQWFQPIDFSKFGSMIEWLTDAIDPWITATTSTVNWINALIAAFGAAGDVVNSPLPDVTRPFGNLIRLFATLDLSDPKFQTIDGWNQLFGSIFVNLTEFDQGVWAALGGATSIPITALTNAQPNLLWNADFEGAISIAVADDWVWDPTVYYSADGLAGSAKVTADGRSHGLRSNPITLGGGQQLNLSARVLTRGLAATGTPLRLDVVTVLNNAQVNVVPVDFFAIPTGAPTDWVNAPSGATTVLLHGVFTMPDDGTADSIRVRIGVDATATAGDVWFDDAVAALTGGLFADLQADINKGSVALTQLLNSWSTELADDHDWTTLVDDMSAAWQTYAATMSGLQADEVVTINEILNNWIPGLFPSNSETPSGILDLQDDSDNATAATAAFLQAINTANTNDAGNWPALIADYQSAYQTWTATMSGLQADEIATLTSMLDALLGISPSTGMMSPANIQSSNGLASLETDITNLVTDFGTAITTGDWTPLVETLFGGTSVGTSIQHSALPSSYSNLNQDLLNLFNDVIFAGGRSWNNIGADLTALINDLVGTNVSHTITPGQIPPAHIGSTGSGADLGEDVTDAASAASEAHSTATAAASTATSAASTASTAQASAASAQSTADNAGNDASSALDQLTAVPSQNVVPLSVDTGQPAAVVASGAGGTNTGLGSVTVSWTDTIPSTANYVLVIVNTATTHSITGITARVTVGSVARHCTLVGAVPYSSSGSLVLLALPNPPAGAASFTVTASDSSSLFSMVAATSMAFSNVVSLSVPVSIEANNASPALSTSFNSSQLVVNAVGSFGTAGSTVGLSSYNRTQQYHAGNFDGGSQFNMDLLAGTVSGVATPNFTASVAHTTNEGFAALAVAVNPPPNILGSYARAYRATTSGTSVSVGTATAGHYGNVFDTSVSSDDLTVGLSTGRITAAYSGTYLFKVGLAFSGLFVTQTMEGLCFVNGQLFERSDQQWYASSTQTGYTWSCPVYLNAGDYVEPGCDFGSTSLITVVGDSAGTKTYMSLSLLNRSLL